MSKTICDIITNLANGGRVIISGSVSPEDMLTEVEIDAILRAQSEQRKMSNLNLDCVCDALKPHASLAWLEGRIDDVLCCMDNTDLMAFVCDNTDALMARGLYEHALVCAYAATRTNNHHISIADQRLLWGCCDRGRLRELAPLPTHEGPITLYRGVAGTGRARMVRGMSWTSDLDTAMWFARRGMLAGLADPGVYRIRLADAEHILAYTNDRDEEEYVCLLPTDIRITRLPVGLDDEDEDYDEDEL